MTRAEPETGPVVPDEHADLLADYERLGRAMVSANGSELSALSRERRMIRSRLNELDLSGEGTVLDEVAARREAQASAPRVPARRRQSR
jgi:hypothetical protein